MRQNMRKPNEKALSFSYAFLGVRLQCAECHKHPFDQWSQSDFQHFTAFFNRVSSGVLERGTEKEMIAKLDLNIDPKLGGNKLRRELESLARGGTVVPFPEVYVTSTKKSSTGGKKDKGKTIDVGRVITPKVLGGEEEVDQNYDDPRQPLMDWLRQKDNPYFARAFVNRVWAHYFNVGIVEPADDMNLANAPSNKELLDYLAAAFIEHDFDVRWLMREVANSETYQRSWHTNATNEFDLRNFSHAVPRRLPAEVVYDAIVAATAGEKEFVERREEPVDRCSIGLARGYTQRVGNNTSYALSVFGKPKRETPCDCERSNEPSLLQTVFLRNDNEMFQLITRRNGWFHENMAALDELKDGKIEVETVRRTDGPNILNEVRFLERDLAEVREDLAKAKKKGKKADEDELRRLRKAEERLESRISDLRKEADARKKVAVVPVEKVAAMTPAELVAEAYLRTFNRYPSEQEKAQGEEYLGTSSDLASGLRDLVWALLNSKEFVVNH